MITLAPSRSDDLFDLRSGELAVEQDDAGAGAGRPVHRDEEPAVVAGQDRYPVAALHPHCQQPVGDLVRGLVELLECDLAVVVDDRGAVRVRRALSAGIMPNSPQRRMSASIAAMFCGGSSLNAPASTS